MPITPQKHITLDKMGNYDIKQFHLVSTFMI